MEHLPPWLRHVPLPARPPGHGEPQAEVEPEIPAWLRELQQEVAADASADAGLPPTQRPNLESTAVPPAPPLSPAAAEPVAPPQPTSSSEPEAEALPDWLRAEPTTPPAPEAEALPDWLRAEPSPPPAPEETSVVETVTTPLAKEAVVPDTLLSTTQAPTTTPKGAAQQPTPQPPVRAEAAADLPPWLVGEASGSINDLTSGPALPSWLQDLAAEPLPLQPPPPPPASSPKAEAEESTPFLSGTELPSWLRIPEPEAPPERAEDQSFAWLQRLARSEQEEGLVRKVTGAIVPLRPDYRLSGEQLAAVGLLQQIAQSPYPLPTAPVAAAPPSLLQRVGVDRLLYLLLFLALLAALLIPDLSRPFQSVTPGTPGVAELDTLLDSLGSESVVLVAYEWAAPRSSELRPLEQATISRLIARQAKLILLSSDLQGTILSFDAIEPLRAAGYNQEQGRDVGGRDYLLLGYQPGGELALRRLAQDLRGELRSDFAGQDGSQSLVANYPDGSPRLRTISDLSMILVMGDSLQDVQAWMEQVHRAAPKVPIAFVLPEEALPLARPYLRQSGVYAVAGQRAAQELQSNDPGSDQLRLTESNGRLAYAVAIFLLLLLIGALSSALAWLWRRWEARRGY